MCQSNLHQRNVVRNPCISKSIFVNKKSLASSAGTRTVLPSTIVSTYPSEVKRDPPCIEGPRGSARDVARSACTDGDVGGDKDEFDAYRLIKFSELIERLSSLGEERPPKRAEPSSAVAVRAKVGRDGEGEVRMGGRGLLRGDGGVAVVWFGWTVGRVLSSKSKSSRASMEGNTMLGLSADSKSPKSSPSSPFGVGVKLSKGESEKLVSKPLATVVAPSPKASALPQASSYPRGREVISYQVPSMAKQRETKSYIITA